LEQPYEDIPAHLASAITAFVEGACSDSDLLFTVLVRARLDFPDPRNNAQGYRIAHQYIQSLAYDDPGQMLDLVEIILAIQPSWELVSQLIQALEDGNSIYRLRDDYRGLELRVAIGVREAVEEAIRVAGTNSAGTHLIESWNEAYGRTADPVKAYSEAIKAVEAATIPIVSPNNSKATLGTVIGELRSNLTAWQFVIQPGEAQSMETVLRMAQLLWNGQTSRHGGAAPTVPETPEQARTAVHLAATLVQWFASGAIT
jgi:hypothetical protein